MERKVTERLSLVNLHNLLLVDKSLSNPTDNAQENFQVIG